MAEGREWGAGAGGAQVSAAGRPRLQLSTYTPLGRTNTTRTTHRVRVCARATALRVRSSERLHPRFCRLSSLDRPRSPAVLPVRTLAYRRDVFLRHAGALRPSPSTGCPSLWSVVCHTVAQYTVPFIPDPLESRPLLKPASGARRLNPARDAILNRTLASNPRTPHPAPCTLDAGR